MNKLLLIAFIAAFFSGLLLVESVNAQQNWSVCPDSSAIVRCETYDCPNGDTNGDGLCRLNDQGARLSDSRNDPFCANPLSGCGEVHYFGQGDIAACTVRVKEAGNKCDLYKAGNPIFTPVPSSSPRPTSSPSASPTVSPTASPKTSATPKATTKGGNTLPETGAPAVAIIGLLSTGFIGTYLFEKFKRS
jgi:hypothetical protein